MKMVMIMLMKMMMMTTPEGVQSTEGDSGRVSPLQSPPTVDYRISIFFAISTFVCREEKRQRVCIEGFWLKDTRTQMIEVSRTVEGGDGPHGVT
jgi:hypothetical protein